MQTGSDSNQWLNKRTKYLHSVVIINIKIRLHRIGLTSRCQRLVKYHHMKFCSHGVLTEIKLEDFEIETFENITAIYLIFQDRPLYFSPQSTICSSYLRLWLCSRCVPKWIRTFHRPKRWPVTTPVNDIRPTRWCTEKPKMPLPIRRIGCTG